MRVVSPLNLTLLPQDVVQQNNTLIEEMLYLIIMLVGEFTLPCLVSRGKGTGGTHTPSLPS